MNADPRDPPIMLVVEDNGADVVFFREALEVAEVPATLHVVANGDLAVKFLRRLAPYAGAPRPHVMVLDLNLPLMNGREVLAEAAHDPALSGIPVAILTTSTCDGHLIGLYPAGRCLYFAKTADFGEMQAIVRRIASHARLEYRPSAAAAAER